MLFWEGEGRYDMKVFLGMVSFVKIQNRNSPEFLTSRKLSTQQQCFGLIDRRYDEEGLIKDFQRNNVYSQYISPAYKKFKQIGDAKAVIENNISSSNIPKP